MGRWKGEGLERHLIRPALLLRIPWREAPGTQGHGHGLCMAMLKSESVFGPDCFPLHTSFCAAGGGWWWLSGSLGNVLNTESSVLGCSSVLDARLVHWAEKILDINKIKVYNYSSVPITQIKQL